MGKATEIRRPGQAAPSIHDQLLSYVRDDFWVANESSLAAKLRTSPSSILQSAGMTADPWQAALLNHMGQARDAAQYLILCSRQSGKSQTAAAAALLTALLDPPATVLVISRAQRQSAEVLRKVKELHRAYRGQHVRPRPFAPVHLDRAALDLESTGGIATGDTELVQDSVLSIELSNGSRVICLPGKADTTVGYSAVSLLILDEAARIPDDVYRYMRPMLAVSQGRILALSTPFGKRGWFYDAWVRCDEAKSQSLAEPWRRIRITADDCPRISQQFLQEERNSIGAYWYNQEYLVEFNDAIGAVFSNADIQASLADIEPLSI